MLILFANHVVPGWGIPFFFAENVKIPTPATYVFDSVIQCITSKIWVNTISHGLTSCC